MAGLAPGSGPRELAPLAAVAFERAAQLLFLVLHEPADHLPPQRLGQLRWQALLGGARLHLVDDLLDAPGNVRLSWIGLELPGAVDVAEALRNQIDERGVDAVDLIAHLPHVGTFPRAFRVAHSDLLPALRLPSAFFGAALLAAPDSHQRCGTVKRPAASSIACAARNSVASSKGLPISCRPSGVPSPDRPAGTDMPGSPAMFTVT